MNSKHERRGRSIVDRQRDHSPLIWLAVQAILCATAIGAFLLVVDRAS